MRKNAAFAAMLGLLLLASGAAGPPMARAEGLTDVSISVETAFFNKYVWRGLVLTDDPVIQPSVTAGLQGFEFNVWANLDGGDVNENRGEINELDVTVGYGLDLAQFSLAGGVVYYTFPNTVYDPTTEAFASLGLNTPLSPTVTGNWDFDQVDGWYATFDIGQTLEFPGSHVVALEIAAGVGYGSREYNEAYYAITDEGLIGYHAEASLPLTFNGHWTLTPVAHYSAFINDDIKEQHEEEYDLAFGVILSAEF